MASDNSFDVVSKIDLQEVANAIQQAIKEIHTRFDLKDSKSDIALEGKEAIVLSSIDEYKLKAVNDILQNKLVKRHVPLKGLDYGAVEPAAGSTVRQRVKLQQGIPIETASAARETMRIRRSRCCTTGLGRRDCSYCNPRARRHHRRSAHSPRSAIGQYQMGKLKVRPSRRLALHAGLQDRPGGAELQSPRSPHWTHAADGRRRADADGAPRPHH